MGHPLENVDLWRVMRRALTVLATAKIQIRVKHVPAHVGVYGNEKADRLSKAAARRAHLAAARTDEQRQDQAIEANRLYYYSYFKQIVVFIHKLDTTHEFTSVV